MHRAYGVAHCAFADAAVFFGGSDGLFKVFDVIEGVENADNVNAVFDAEANEFVHDVVGIVFVTQNVLTSEQHLKFAVRHGFSQSAQPFPRVFVQKAQACVEGCAAPAFNAVVAHFVDGFCNRQHFRQLHTSCRLRLMRVS